MMIIAPSLKLLRSEYFEIKKLSLKPEAPDDIIEAHKDFIYALKHDGGKKVKRNKQNNKNTE